MFETRHFTAQIRASDGLVIAVTAGPLPLGEPPAGVIFVTLDAYHTEYCGWTYANGVFTPPQA